MASNTEKGDETKGAIPKRQRGPESEAPSFRNEQDDQQRAEGQNTVRPSRLSVEDEQELLRHFAHLNVVETDSMETKKYKQDQAKLLIEKEVMRRELEDLKKQKRDLTAQNEQSFQAIDQLTRMLPPPQQQPQPQVPQPGGHLGQPVNLPPPSSHYQYSRDGRRSRSASGVRIQEPNDPLPYRAEELQGAQGLNLQHGGLPHDAGNCPSRLAPVQAHEAQFANVQQPLFANNELVRAPNGHVVNRPNIIVPPVLPHIPNPMEPITRSSGTHSNIAIMSRGTTQNIYMANPQEEQLNVQRMFIEQEQEHLNMFGQVAQMVNELRANQQQPQQPYDQRALDDVIQRLHERIQLRRERTDGKAKQIKQAENYANVYTSRLRIPPLAENNSHYNSAIISRLEPKNIGVALRKFNRERDPEADFADTWNQILNYTKTFLLTEQSYLDIILHVLDGSAFRVANDMVTHNFPLHEVLENLEMQFCKKKNINDYIDDINNFERMQDEDINSAMSRAQIIVQKISKSYPPEEWESNRERILNSILGQIITMNTRANLEAEEAKHSRIGTKMSYKAKLYHVENHEKAYNERPMHAVRTVINACTGLPNVKRVDSTQQMLSRLESLEKQHRAFALNVSHPKTQRPRSNSRPRNTTKEVTAHDYAVDELLAEAAGTQLPKDDWDKKEKRQAASKDRARRPSYRLSRSRSRDPFRHSSASKRPIQRERSRQRSFSRDRKSNRENVAPGYERSRSRGRSVERRTPHTQPPQQPVQQVQQQQQIVQPPVQIYNPNSQLFPQHTQNNEFAYAPATIMSDLSQQTVAPVTLQSNGAVQPVLPQGWTPANLYGNPSQAPWNFNQGYFNNNQGKRGQGQNRRRGGRQNNNNYQNRNQNYKGRSNSRGYDGRGRNRSWSKNRDQWSNQSGSARQDWRGRSPSVDRSRALEYHGASGQRGQTVSYGRGHPSPQRPHISYDNVSRKFTFDDGKLQMTYCNQGCVGKFHPTDECPYKNKSLN